MQLTNRELKLMYDLARGQLLSTSKRKDDSHESYVTRCWVYSILAIKKGEVYIKNEQGEYERLTVD